MRNAILIIILLVGGCNQNTTAPTPLPLRSHLYLGMNPVEVYQLYGFDPEDANSRKSFPLEKFTTVIKETADGTCREQVYRYWFWDNGNRPYLLTFRSCKLTQKEITQKEADTQKFLNDIEPNNPQLVKGLMNIICSLPSHGYGPSWLVKIELDEAAQRARQAQRATSLQEFDNSWQQYDWRRDWQEQQRDFQLQQIQLDTQQIKWQQQRDWNRNWLRQHGFGY